MPSGAGWSDHGLLADVGMALACAAGTSGAWSHVGLQKTGQLVDEGRKRLGHTCWADQQPVCASMLGLELGFGLDCNMD